MKEKEKLNKQFPEKAQKIILEALEKRNDFRRDAAAKDVRPSVILCKHVETVPRFNSSNIFATSRAGQSCDSRRRELLGVGTNVTFSFKKSFSKTSFSETILTIVGLRCKILPPFTASFKFLESVR